MKIKLHPEFDEILKFQLKVIF